LIRPVAHDIMMINDDVSSHLAVWCCIIEDSSLDESGKLLGVAVR